MNYSLQIEVEPAPNGGYFGTAPWTEKTVWGATWEELYWALVALH